MEKAFKPGEVAKFSGKVEVVGPRGGKTGIFRKVEKNKQFPPTPEPNQFYVKVEKKSKTDNKVK